MLGQLLLHNYQSWLEFLKRTFLWDIGLADLIIVTGCDLASGWALMTRAEHSKHISLRFSIGIPDVSFGEFRVWGHWENATNIHINCGPQVETPNEVVDDDGANGGLHVSGLGREKNQCIFVRGYHIIERFRLWRLPKRLRAAALAEPKDSKHPPEPSDQCCPAVDPNADNDNNNDKGLEEV